MVSELRNIDNVMLRQHYRERVLNKADYGTNPRDF